MCSQHFDCFAATEQQSASGRRQGRRGQFIVLSRPRRGLQAESAVGAVSGPAAAQPEVWSASDFSSLRPMLGESSGQWRPTKKILIYQRFRFDLQY